MGIFESIKRGLEEHKEHHDHVKQFENILMEAVASGSLTKVQEDQIRRAFGELKLASQDLDALRIPAYHAAVKAIAAMDAISPQHIAGLQEVQRFLKVEDERIAQERQEIASAIVQQAAAQGGVSGAKEEQVRQMLSQLNVSAMQLQKTALPSLRNAFARAIQADSISKEQVVSLVNLQNILDVRDDQIQEEKSKLSHLYVVSEIQQGRLPTATDDELVLKKAEVIHWRVTASLLEERVVERGYVGGSHGVSVRIAKGLTYHVGSSRGHLVSRSAVVPVSRGHLLVTNQRIVFRGDSKSLNFALPHVLDVHMYSDGIRITDDKGKPYTLELADPAQSDILGATVQSVLSAISS